MLGLGCIYSQVVCVCALYGGLVVRRGRKLSLCAGVECGCVCCACCVWWCRAAVRSSLAVVWHLETPRCTGLISSRVRHNKTHPNGHHDVHARQTRDRRGKNRQNFYLQPDWRSSAVPVQPVMSRVGWVSDGTCTKRKMFDLPRTPNGGCVAYDRGGKVWSLCWHARQHAARGRRGLE